MTSVCYILRTDKTKQTHQLDHHCEGHLLCPETDLTYVAVDNATGNPAKKILTSSNNPSNAIKRLINTKLWRSWEVTYLIIETCRFFSCRTSLCCPVVGSIDWSGSFISRASVSVEYFSSTCGLSTESCPCLTNIIVVRRALANARVVGRKRLWWGEINVFPRTAQYKLIGRSFKCNRGRGFSTEVGRLHITAR